MKEVLKKITLAKAITVVIGALALKPAKKFQQIPGKGISKISKKKK